MWQIKNRLFIWFWIVFLTCAAAAAATAAAAAQSLTEQTAEQLLDTPRVWRPFVRTDKISLIRSSDPALRKAGELIPFYLVAYGNQLHKYNLGLTINATEPGEDTLLKETDQPITDFLIRRVSNQPLTLLTTNSEVMDLRRQKIIRSDAQGNSLVNLKKLELIGGNLLMASGRGLLTSRPASDMMFNSVPLNSGTNFLTPEIRALVSNTDGSHSFIATSQGLYHSRDGGISYSELIIQIPGNTHLWINDLMIQSLPISPARTRDLLWIATSSGIVIYNIEDGDFYQFSTANSRLSGDWITSMIEIPIPDRPESPVVVMTRNSGLNWVLFRDGRLLVNPETTAESNIPNDSPQMAAFVPERGELFILFKAAGLYYTQVLSGTAADLAPVENLESNNPNEYVLNAFLYHNVEFSNAPYYQISTGNGPHPPQIEFYGQYMIHGDGPHQVRSRRNEAVITTFNRINFIWPTLERLEPEPGPGVVYTISQESQKAIKLGRINSLNYDHQGNINFATDNGVLILTALDPPAWTRGEKFMLLKPSSVTGAGNKVKLVHRDINGRMFHTTADNYWKHRILLYSSDSDELIPYSEKLGSRPSETEITCLLLSERGLLIGTSTRGLLLFDGERLRGFNRGIPEGDPGLPELTAKRINHLISDRRHRIWAATDNGLMRIETRGPAAWQRWLTPFKSPPGDPEPLRIIELVRGRPGYIIAFRRRLIFVEESTSAPKIRNLLTKITPHPTEQGLRIRPSSDFELHDLDFDGRFLWIALTVTGSRIKGPESLFAVRIFDIRRLLPPLPEAPGNR